MSALSCVLAWKAVASSSACLGYLQVPRHGADNHLEREANDAAADAVPHRDALLDWRQSVFSAGLTQVGGHMAT